MLDIIVNNSKENLIIFIHGFLGGRDTWIRTDGKMSIMEKLISDVEFLKNFDIAVFDYFSKVTDVFQKKEGWGAKLFGGKGKNKKYLDINDISDLLETAIKIGCKNYKRIILVAHSMGGLISKQLILKQLNKDNSNKISLYISLAVPHNGSNLALLGKLILSNPQASDLTPLGTTIDEMTRSWIMSGDTLPRTIYFQGKTDDVVPKTSSIGFDSRKINIDVNFFEEDHFSIVTPTDELVVLSVKQQCIHILNQDSATFVSQQTDSGEKVIDSNTSLFEAELRDQSIIKISEKLKVMMEREFHGLDFFHRSFINSHGDLVSYEQLKKEAVSSDFILVHGIGGIGKSLILRRLIIDLLPKYKLPFFVLCDAKNWNDKYSSELEESNALEHKISSLLDGFESEVSFSTIKDLAINKVDHKVEKIIFVDGMNEVASDETRKKILNLLKIIHSNFGFKVIVTSRHSQKSEYKGYEMFKVEKIDQGELGRIVKGKFGKNISDYTTRNLEYLSLPFFLEIAIKSGKDKIAEYSRYISNHVFKSISAGNEGLYLRELSGLAYDAFQSEQKFIISKLNPAHEKKYVRDKILLPDGSGYKFEHHLVNEFLVAYKISTRPELWNDDEFDKITFEDKKSFEIIQMILEQLPDKENGEKYLRAVYNWNFYAVLHCIKYVENKCSDEFARVIILILSEKLFDRFDHTRVRIMDYLQDLIKKFDIKGIDDISEIGKMSIADRADEFRKVLNLNKEYFIGTKYEGWYNMFSNSVNTDTSVVAKVLDDDPVIGWSCSNVLRRGIWNSKLENQLSILFETSKNYVQKWRIVHAYGNAATNEACEFLLDVLKKHESLWVSYGAARSILEIAMFNLSIVECESFLSKLFDVLESKNYGEIIIAEVRACLNDKVDVDKVPLVHSFYEKMINSKHKNFDEKELIEMSRTKFNEKNGN